MAVLLQYRRDRADRWEAALRQAMPGERVLVWPDVPDPDAVELVVTFVPEPGTLRAFRNLRLIAATGAGVNAMLDPSIEMPSGVPLVRLVDPELTDAMRQYVLATVMRHFRQLDQFEAFQRERRWVQLPRPDIRSFVVGLLGLGVLGTAAAELLRIVGFPVVGWSRREKSVPGVDCCHGPEGLKRLLDRTLCLVCLLPLTPATAGIIDANLLCQLPRGAYVINAGRGGHLVDDDLLAALDSGQIACATLDVFHDEPLPEGHPFWTHPRVTITPDIASLTVPESAALRIAENLRRLRSGEPLLDLVDPDSGY